MTLPKFAFIRGAIVPYAEAHVGMLSHTLNYGTGVFGGLRGYWSEVERQVFVFRPHDHFRRFLQSTKMMYMNLPYSIADLVNAMTGLLQTEDLRTDCYIRPLAYFIDESVGAPLTALTPDVSMVCIPFCTPVKSYSGVDVTFSSWRRIDDNMIPARGKIAGAYVNSHIARAEAMRSGFDDALLLNASGHIAEASIANIFLVRNDVVTTPPVTEDILEGITRQSVLTLLRNELRFQIEERPIDRSEIYVADEAFLCGTATEIASIRHVDCRAIGSGEVGPVTASLQALMGNIFRGQVAEYRDWCAPVYSDAAATHSRPDRLA
jgi:branched-chain amino acid aminotransferase